MKSVILIAAMLVGTYSNAFTLKSITIHGHTNLTPSANCKLQVSTETNGSVIAAVYFNNEQAYGFVVERGTVEALKNQSNLNEVQIAGRLQYSGDRALFISTTNNELTSFAYKGLNERSGKLYGVKCIF